VRTTARGHAPATAERGNTSFVFTPNPHSAALLNRLYRATPFRVMRGAVLLARASTMRVACNVASAMGGRGNGIEVVG
jgi:hypothetical protein